MTSKRRVVLEMQRIWASATPDTIVGQLRRARELIEQLPEEDRPDLEEKYVALERLARWLHDL